MVRDDQASGRPKGRIFWLGAHKLLVNTELPRLRTLGYEVFYPPYLSHILDQSAASVWDRKQPTTLPPEIYDKLSRHNFFYDSINPVIADILNEYFDAVVVTIVARWAAELLRVFNGTIIFRAYGQTHLLSDEFEDAGVRPLIEGRTNFHCCPHAQETLEGEADWLRQRSTVIPYCLTNEVFDVRGSWHRSSERNDQILVTAPNILGNPFHRAHYDFLKEYFYQKHFRYCGVQLVDIDDDQVVGVLGRHTQLSMFANAAGYLYTYRDSRVCYLPPVEMIVMGGPVAYFSGSLLARYIGKGGPGEATSVMDAHRITARLRANDRIFIEEVQASQAHVADLYDPARVWPFFDREMQRMLGTYPAGALSRPASREDRLRQLVRAVIDAADPVLLAQEGSAIASSLATSILHRPPADTEVQYLRSVLQEEGTVAALKEVIALNSGSRELLERLVEHPAPRQAGVADLYRDFAPPGSFIGIGRWSFHAGGNKCIRVVDRGETGFVIFGPYAALPVGSFRIDLRARIAHSHVVAGVLDVCVAGDVRASRQINSSSSLFETFSVEFEVTDPEQRFEFRVQSNGSVDMEIESLVLIRTRS